jgi:hypothetical protein
LPLIREFLARAWSTGHYRFRGAEACEAVVFDLARWRVSRKHRDLGRNERGQLGKLVRHRLDLISCPAINILPYGAAVVVVDGDSMRGTRQNQCHRSFSTK